MKAFRKAAAGLLCLGVAAAQAQWAQQPSDVMGIRLGATLDRIGIQPCSASNEMPGRVSTATICYQPLAGPKGSERTFYKVHNAPQLVAGGQAVMIDVAYGQVVGVLVSGSATRFDKMVSVLETRYGPATETIKGPLRDRPGSERAELTKRWRGDRVAIEATNPFGAGADEFAVYWYDLAAQARRDAQVDRETTRIADRL